MATRFTSLRSRDFRLLCLGEAVSLSGSQMQQVAVIWQLYQVTHHDPLSLGALGLARVLPLVVFSLVGGVAADALDRRKLMLYAQVVLALASATLAVATHFDAVTAPVIYAVASFSGAAAAFESPARQSMLPQLVTLEELPNALSIYATLWQVAQVGGPALGGLILSRWGVMPIYIFDAVSFGAVIASLLAMGPTPARTKRNTIGLGAVVDGLRFMVRSPVLLATMLLDFVGTFFAGSMLLMPIFADQLLHVGGLGYGFLFAAQPAGAAIVGALMSSRPPVRRQGFTVVSMVGVYGLAIAAFGLAGNFPLALLALAISGGADTASMVVRQTLRQTLTPDELRGRMTSINMIFAMGGPQLGEAEAGAVARIFSPRISVASGGFICAGVAVLVGLLAPKLWNYRTPEA